MPRLARRCLVTACIPLLLWVARPSGAAGKIGLVALFPVENLAGSIVPAEDVRQALEQRLTTAGIDVVSGEALSEFMTRHRVRYAAGIDAATAQALRQELSVEGVVIASVELSQDTMPPKVALTARLVSTGAPPLVVWADDAGLAGDEAPGLYGLGLVDDFQELLDRALARVAGSLVEYITTGEARTAVKRAGKFRPKVVYNGWTVEPGRPTSVALLPFFNVSDRRNAGEILALLFARHLSAFGAFRVIDTGEVRQQLLQARVIMEGGVSIGDAELVASILEADLVLAGRVLHYRDYIGLEVNPRVEFSAVLIERASRRVVWSSQSYNDGMDGVRFFGRGRTSTAHGMATQMVRLSVESLAGVRQ